MKLESRNANMKREAERALASADKAMINFSRRLVERVEDVVEVAPGLQDIDELKKLIDNFLTRLENAETESEKEPSTSD